MNILTMKTDKIQDTSVRLDLNKFVYHHNY